MLESEAIAINRVIGKGNLVRIERVAGLIVWHTDNQHSDDGIFDHAFLHKDDITGDYSFCFYKTSQNWIKTSPIKSIIKITESALIFSTKSGSVYSVLSMKGI